MHVGVLRRPFLGDGPQERFGIRVGEDNVLFGESRQERYRRNGHDNLGIGMAKAPQKGVCLLQIGQVFRKIAYFKLVASRTTGKRISRGSGIDTETNFQITPHFH